MRVSGGQDNWVDGSRAPRKRGLLFSCAVWTLSLLLAANLLASHPPAIAASPNADGNGNASGHGNGASNPGAGFARGHILVAPHATTTREEFDQALARNNGRALGRLGKMDVELVNVPVGKEEETVGKLAKHSKVKFAEVDRLITFAGSANDPNYASAWHLPNIGAPEAWDHSNGAGVIIAILDTGVDGTHPDLAPQMVAGWNHYDNNSDTSDPHGHGTAVAGAAAAATNNGVGVASVAGGARIMPMRISDASGNTYWSVVAQAIQWAADRGARVANLSFNNASASSTIQSAASYLRSKGGVLIVAAGNTGASDASAPTSLVTVVSATDTNDQFASFSTYGSFIDIAAPGNYILTTVRGGGYQYWWGTSFATPLVAGTAALILSRRPDFTAAQVDSTLASTAVDLGAPGKDVYYGSGRLNAAAALQAATGSAPTPDTAPPSAAITAPTGGTVSGIVSVGVNASDNVGVTRVELRANGATVGATTSAPYLFSWNSGSVADGAAALTAVAYDAAGNSKISSAVAVNVANAVAPPPADTVAPEVSILSPTGGSITGTATVRANATDNVGVTLVELRVDGRTVATTNTSPYQFSWNSATTPNGTASLTVVAYDAAGNSAVSSAVSLNVQNGASGSSDSTAPSVTITNPGEGAVISRNISIKTIASDNSGSAGITQKLYIDGSLKASATGGSLTYNWNVKKVPGGAHTIAVTATDAAGNATTAQVRLTRQ